MRWALASDHAGYEMKEAVERQLRAKGLDVTDLGPHDASRTDYPDWGHRLGEAVARGDFDRGVLVCGSGVGISIAANRHAGVRFVVDEHKLAVVLAGRLAQGGVMGVAPQNRLAVVGLAFSQNLHAIA